jgi:hypothetical protein
VAAKASIWCPPGQKREGRWRHGGRAAGDVTVANLKWSRGEVKARIVDVASIRVREASGVSKRMA